jgi:hypothetical protein
MRFREWSFARAEPVACSSFSSGLNFTEIGRDSIFYNENVRKLPSRSRNGSRKRSATKSAKCGLDPNLLHYGTNDIRVLIVDENGPNYFSMVVTTNTCDWSAWRLGGFGANYDPGINSFFISFLLTIVSKIRLIDFIDDFSYH